MTKTFERLFLDGKWVEPESSDTLEAINPATEEAIGTAPRAGRADAARAIQAARSAFDDGPWSRTSPADRASALRRLADAISSRREELTDLGVRETGWTPLMAGWQVERSIGLTLEFADRILSRFDFTTPLQPVLVGGRGGMKGVFNQGLVAREPMGVASLISPFNGPFYGQLVKLVPALAAGCTTIVKGSPDTPLQCAILGEILEIADLPAGVVNVLTGDLDASIEMTTNPAVDMISFTGSDAVGRKVMAQAADGVKRVLLELGGKSACVVFPDVDLDLVADEIARNLTTASGQGCVLLTRAIVHQSISETLQEKVVARLRAVKVGDPTDPTTQMGPVISHAARARIEAMIKDAQEQGAELATGGGRPAGLDRGYYLEPTLFSGVQTSMNIAQNEVFGPVGTFMTFDSDDEAIRMANDTRYGLNGSVFSDDIDRAYQVARRLRTGWVNVNTSYYAGPDAPIGGYKQSGLGREGGVNSLAEYLETKTISMPVGSPHPA